MKSQFPIDPVTDTKALADNAEQVAHDLRRTATAAVGIADSVKVLYEVVYPIVVWLKAKLARSPEKVQVLVSTR
jgi:hypothetical protein